MQLSYRCGVIREWITVPLMLVWTLPVTRSCSAHQRWLKKSKAMIRSFRSFKTGHQHEKNRVVIPNIYSQRLSNMSLFISPSTIWCIYTYLNSAVSSHSPYDIYTLPFRLLYQNFHIWCLVYRIPAACIAQEQKTKKKERLDSVSRKDIKNSVIGGWGRGYWNRHERYTMISCKPTPGIPGVQGRCPTVANYLCEALSA